MFDQEKIEDAADSNTMSRQDCVHSEMVPSIQIIGKDAWDYVVHFGAGITMSRSITSMPFDTKKEALAAGIAAVAAIGGPAHFRTEEYADGWYWEWWWPTVDDPDSIAVGNRPNYGKSSFKEARAAGLKYGSLLNLTRR